MPSRLITGAILLFWLAMTAWLIQREVLPMMLASASPSYLPTLTDEIGSPVAAWRIYSKGKRVGSASSRVTAGPEQTFEFHTTLMFNDSIPLLRQVESVDRLTEEGKLRAMKVSFLTIAGNFEVRGEVVDQVMAPKVLINGEEQKMFDLGQIDMAGQDSPLNTLMLVNRLRNLRDKQSWPIRSFNPFQGIQNKVLGADLIKSASIERLIATVSTDTFKWGPHEVPSYKIEYQEPGKEVTARTWVRRLDGLVMQQEMTHAGMELVFRRIRD